jgi:hypothetical protein
MQNRSLLGDIYSFSAKHGVDAGTQARLLGKLQEQPHCFVGDAVLRIIKINALRLNLKASSSCWILSAEISTMESADRRGMRPLGLPGFATNQDLLVSVMFAPLSVDRYVEFIASIGSER